MTPCLQVHDELALSVKTSGGSTERAAEIMANVL
jgi:hypothetical protein